MTAEKGIKEEISKMRSKSPDEKEVGQVLSIRSYEGAAEDEDKVIDPVLSHSDNMLLADIGYKPELARHFSTFQVFGVAYSIMGLLPSIASVLSTAMAAGPAGAIWGWVIAGVGIELIGISVSQLGSSCPTSGGLYYWSNYYAPAKYRSFISFLVGNTNTLALVGALCSVDYGFSQELLSVVVIGKDGDFEVTPAKTYGVFVACVFSHILLTCAASKDCARLQTASSIANTSLIILFIIVLPIGASPKFNDAATIFGKIENFSNWPTGWQFVLSWMPAIWTIGGFDSCVHMSEEAHNATKAVPVGIIGSITMCYILGFVILVVTCACIQTDNISEHIIGTKFGQPMAQVIYDALGKKWAMAFMVLICACQFMMGASILTAMSRQIWAFSRDNGLPFSFWIRRVNQKLSVPINAVWTGGCTAIVVGLLCLIGTTAAEALFSLSVAGNYFSWTTPVLLSITTGKSKFRPGPFYLGKFWSAIINWFAVAFAAFVITMVMFPANRNPGKLEMNYTCVITPGVWILSSIYYFIYAHKAYHGPIKTIDEDGEVSYEQDLSMTPEEGLQKEKLKSTLGL